MTKIRIIAMCLSMLLLWSCGEDKTDEAPLRQFTKSMITEYPNYKSNEIARKAMLEALENHAKSQINTVPSDLTDLDLTFSHLVEGKTEENKCLAAFNYSNWCDVEVNLDSKKYVGGLIKLTVTGLVDRNTAAQLDGNKKYHVSGKMFEWSPTDLTLQILATGDIDYGTYYLEDITVKEVR